MSIEAITLRRLEEATQKCQTANVKTRDLLMRVQAAISNLELFEQAIRDPGRVSPATIEDLLQIYNAKEARELPEKINAAIEKMIEDLQSQGVANQTIINQQSTLAASTLPKIEQGAPFLPGTEKSRLMPAGHPRISQRLSDVQAAAKALSARIRLMQLNQGHLHRQEELLRQRLEQIREALPQPEPAPMEGVEERATFEQRLRALKEQGPQPDVSLPAWLPHAAVSRLDPAVQPLIPGFAQHLSFESRLHLLRHGFQDFGPNVLQHLSPSFIKSLSPEDFEHFSWQWFEQQTPEDLHALSVRSAELFRGVFWALPEEQRYRLFATHVNQQIAGPGQRKALSEATILQLPPVPSVAPLIKQTIRLQVDSLPSYLQSHLPESFFTEMISENVIEALHEEYLLQLRPHVLESLAPEKWDAARRDQRWTPVPPEFANSLSPDVYAACQFDQLAALTPEEMARLQSFGPDFINAHAVLLRYIPLKKFITFEPRILHKLKPDVLAAMDPHVRDGIKPEKWNEFTNEMFDLLNAEFLNKLGREYIGNLTKAAFEHLFRPSMTREQKLEILENFHPDSSRTYFPHLHELMTQRAVETERIAAEEEARKQAAHGAAIAQQATGLFQIGGGVLGASALGVGGLKVGGSYVGQALSSVGFTEAGAGVAAAAAKPMAAVVAGAAGLGIAANLLAIVRQAPTWGSAELAACTTVSIAAGVGVFVFAPAVAGALGVGLAASTAGASLTLPAARLGKRLWPYGKRAWQRAAQHASHALRSKRQAPVGRPEQHAAKKRRMDKPPSGTSTF